MNFAFGERVMYGFSWEKHTRLGRLAVAGVFGFWVLVTGIPAHAALTGSGFSPIGSGHDARPEQGAISSNQVALSQFSAGHRNEAVRLWQSQADRGDAASQFTLGVLYNRGDGGVARDLIQAAHWYRKAAEQGHVIAQYNLGILYATGTGVARDPGAAIQWWRLAALQGHAEAQFNLGLFYAEGTGVQPDAAEAVKWWGLAANQGLAVAQFNLGLMYMKGEGIDENQDEAVRLWRLSASQGFTQAIALLKVLSLD
jgi:TPR repeat protein